MTIDIGFTLATTLLAITVLIVIGFGYNRNK